jgi:predicted nucleotidyltransferase
MAVPQRDKSSMLLGRPKDARSRVGTRQEALERLVEFFRAHGNRYELVSLALFGSFARDEASAFSDVDVAFESARRLSISELTSLLRKLEEMLGRGVDLCELSRVHPLLRPSIAEDLVNVA